MRRALRAGAAILNKSQPIPIPAPVGGWNARDSLSAMPVTDAEIIINWFPETTDVRIRAGSSDYATGLGADVESLMVWKSPTSAKLFAAAGASIFDASSEGAVGSAVVSSLTNARWFDTNFETAGGNFLIAGNGEDTPRTYNGTTWATYTVTGPTEENLIFPFQYKNRLFWIEKGKQSFWYNTQVDAITGTFSEFPIGSQLALGGSVYTAASWTRDGGSGMDDFLALFTDAGECVVYTGTNPANASDWSLVGVYRVPVPLSRRSLQKWGGDLLVLTEAGVFPMSTILSGIEPQAALTDKIRPKVSEAVSVYRSFFGWELTYYPDGRWLIVNVPVEEGDNQEQYVMNTNTGAWARFTGMDANCWAVFENNIYFGGNSAVVQANTGTNDNGADVPVDLKQANSNFGSGNVKRFVRYRPHIATDGSIALAFGWNVDFATNAPSNVPTPTAVLFAVWDEADWDDFEWGDDPRPSGNWQGINGVGTYGAARIAGANNSEQVRLYGGEVVIEGGGIG